MSWNTKIPKFRRFVLQNFPFIEQDFDALTDYQLICKVVEYLNKVIDSQNNLIEQVDTFENLFIELKDYVDNYFDNLDVQEEINNKLDSMVEDGTLQEIITTYIDSNVAWTFDNVAAMKAATNLIDGSYARTLGFHSLNDDGGALYKITDSGTANEMDTIAIGDSLYAHLIYEGEIKTEQFGAYGDGTHDDSTVLSYVFNKEIPVSMCEKTYLCFDIEITHPLIIHGNGAILKRPELDVAPYNKTVEQMKWIRTLIIKENASIDNLTFDNNCFTMWQVSDGYAQEQSASIIIGNNDKFINVDINGCECKNSAGDGILIVNNSTTNINDYISTDTFRGGVTIVGNSEVNINNWVSNSVTAGMRDGIDIEVDSSGASTIESHPLTVNINNVIMDYDLDITVPQYGVVNINNLTQRSFDYTTYNGFTFNVSGTLKVTNSILRRGLRSSAVNQRLRDGGKIIIDNCELYGTTNQPLIILATPSAYATGEELFSIKNSIIDCYDCLELPIIYGKIVMSNNKIKCANSFVVKNVNVAAQPNHLFVEDCDINFGAEIFMQIAKTSSATFTDGVNYHLHNLHLTSSQTSTEIHCVGGSPFIEFSSLICDTPLKIHNQYGGSAILIGDTRVVTVATATDLTFAGWIAGNDIAVAKDTGKRYTYTSGTTWTEIA